MSRAHPSPPPDPSGFDPVPAQFACSSIGHGHSLAVRAGETRLSYQELQARVGELASGLSAAGVGAGDLVAIAMDRSAALVIAILGIWQTGAAFVPLDPGYPRMRLTQMIADAAPKVILTDTHNHPQMTATGGRALLFDQLAAGAAAPFVPVRLAAEDRAYVIFTSGSTGRPKGVEISHGALANLLAAIQVPLQMQPADTLAAVTTFGFDIALLELLLPLMQGATVAIVDKATGGDGKRLAQALQACNATFLQATPITWRLLADSGWSGNPELTAISGGELLPRALANTLLRCCGRVFNAYGPTEATIWAMLEPVAPGTGPVPIGRPLSNYSALVLDAALVPVAAGDTGQLYLGGPGVATGYLDRPEETAERFVDHPGHGRLYATGDLVRALPDGRLDFCGRADDQIKIRGYRVEPGDIEAQLCALPGVKEALVMIREDTPGAPKLVAYLITGAEVLDATALRRGLNARLPDYMIPHHFVPLTAFPKTPNDKIDRKALPVPPVAGVGGAAALSDPLEAHLRSIWSEVLGTGAIGADTDFFDLGGDSIQAARVTNRLEDWLGEVVWPIVLFDAPTITELANYLRRTYPKAIAARNLSVGVATEPAAEPMIDARRLAGFQAQIAPLAPHPTPARKNPQAIFILNPPRSGSTLLRVMLAGHLDLFAPPEIELLTFNTMAERAAVFSGRESYRLEGTIRAVMAARGCGVDDARAILERYEQGATTVAEFYGVMQSWLGDRRLVDKTPANTLDAGILRRIETYFDNPLYIHLTRHPLGMIRSFLEARLNEVFFRRTAHNFSPRELAELIWLTAHGNTLEALAAVPAERQFRLSFETLTRAPEDTITALCDFLSIRPQPDMLIPWQDKAQKMTDGLHAVSKMMGDPKFHRHKSIDAAAADRWRDDMPGAGLSNLTRDLARQLGYTDFGDGPGEEDREEFVL